MLEIKMWLPFNGVNESLPEKIIVSNGTNQMVAYSNKIHVNLDGDYWYGDDTNYINKITHYKPVVIMNSSIIPYRFALSKKYNPINNCWHLSLHQVNTADNTKALICSRSCKKDSGWFYNRHIKEMKKFAKIYCIIEHTISYDLHEFSINLEIK